LQSRRAHRRKGPGVFDQAFFDEFLFREIASSQILPLVVTLSAPARIFPRSRADENILCRERFKARPDAGSHEHRCPLSILLVIFFGKKWANMTQ
jgi:hypothetical protein